MLSDQDRTRLRQARSTAISFSHDPSTRVGALIADEAGAILSSGYNAFPEGVEATQDRLTNRVLKYQMIVHAEMRAVLKSGLASRTLYVWPLFPCSICAGPLIEAGVKRVVAPHPKQAERWTDSCLLALAMFEEAGVEVVYYNPEELG